MKLDIAAIKARADKATAGPWESDATQNEGDYGSGPDCGSGFSSYEVAAEKGRICDTINSDVAMVCEEYDEDGSTAFDEVGQANMDFIAHARTDIPDLIAAIEAAERERDDWAKHLPVEIVEQGLEITRCHNRITALEAALSYYAKEHKNPSEGPWGLNSTDFGNVARRALEAKQPEDKPEPKRKQTFQEKQNEYDEDNWGCEND